MALIGQSKTETGITSIGFIFSCFLPLNFSDLVEIFATKFLGLSGTVSKCATNFLRVDDFLPRGLVALFPSVPLIF